MKSTPLPSHLISALEPFGLNTLDPSHLCWMRFHKGEFIHREGEEMRGILLVLDGKAKVTVSSSDGKALLFSLYSANGILGEVELMRPSRIATTTVQALSDFSCVEIPFSHYEQTLRNNLLFMNHIAATLAAKLDRCTRNSAANLLTPLASRLCSYILLICEGDFFSESRTELAQLLGVSYRHLLRTLEKLCIMGMLSKEGTGYRILDRSALQERGDA